MRQSFRSTYVRGRVTARLLYSLAFFVLSACGGEPTDRAVGEGMGALAPYLPASGENGSWRLDRGDDGLTLTNETDPDALTYFYVDADAFGAGERRVAVDVMVDGADPGARAGLLYGFDPTNRTYFLFAVEASGAVSFIRRGPDGFEPMMQTETDKIKDGWNRLHIEEDGRNITLKINGAQVGQMSANGIGRGATGIAAGGSGAFQFADFSLTPPPPEAQPETDARAETSRAASAPPQPAPSAAPSQQARANDFVRLKRFDLMDMHGFAEPTPVLSFLAPADWSLEGGVTWARNWSCLVSELMTYRARVTSPDGSVGFEVFPLYTTVWTPDPATRRAKEQSYQQRFPGACPVGQPFSAEAYIRNLLVPGFRRNSRLVAVERADDVAAAAYQRMADELRGAGRGQQQFRADAARAKLTEGGRAEWIFATTAVLESPAPALNGGTTQLQTALVERAYGFYAPADEIDNYEALAAAMVSSVRLNPNWFKAVENVHGIIGRAGLDAARRQAAANKGYFEDMQRMRVESYEYQSAMQDKAHKAWTRVVRGVEGYADPATNTQIDVPNTYNSVWTNGLGQFVLVRPEATDPNPYFDGDWREMTRMPF